MKACVCKHNGKHGKTELGSQIGSTSGTCSCINRRHSWVQLAPSMFSWIHTPKTSDPFSLFDRRRNAGSKSRLLTILLCQKRQFGLGSPRRRRILRGIVDHGAISLHHLRASQSPRLHDCSERTTPHRSTYHSFVVCLSCRNLTSQQPIELRWAAPLAAAQQKMAEANRESACCTLRHAAAATEPAALDPKALAVVVALTVRAGCNSLNSTGGCECKRSWISQEALPYLAPTTSAKETCGNVGHGVGAIPSVSRNDRRLSAASSEPRLVDLSQFAFDANFLQP